MTLFLSFREPTCTWALFLYRIRLPCPFAAPLIRHIGLQVVEGEAQYLGERLDNQVNLLEQLAVTDPFQNGKFPSIKKEIDHQLRRHNDIWLSMEYEGANGEEYETHPGDLKPSTGFKRELLTGDKLSLISQPIADGSDYFIYIGTKVMNNEGTTKGLLIIKVKVKLGLFAKEKMSQLTDMWFIEESGKAILNSTSEKRPVPDIINFDKQSSLQST